MRRDCRISARQSEREFLSLLTVLTLAAISVTCILCIKFHLTNDIRVTSNNNDNIPPDSSRVRQDWQDRRQLWLKLLEITKPHRWIIFVKNRMRSSTNVEDLADLHYQSLSNSDTLTNPSPNVSALQQSSNSAMANLQDLLKRLGGHELIVSRNLDGSIYSMRLTIYSSMKCEGFILYLSSEYHNEQEVRKFYSDIATIEAGWYYVVVRD